MAYVPGYTGDVFISYAHLDDGDGWVTEVKSKIAARLTADLAGEPEIWFDADRLRTGDIFKQEIHNKLSNTLILLAVISPSFLKSQFCMEEELERFLDQFGREVIQLQKVRLTDGTSPPLTDAIYEPLFDEGTDAPLRGEHLDAKLNAVISTIRRKMEEARHGCQRVYLAQPRNDSLRSACKVLGSALHSSGLAVLPNEIVSARTLESKIQKWIEDAGISIHVRTDPIDPVAGVQLRVAERAGTPTIVLDDAPRPVDIPGIVERTAALLAQGRPPGEVYLIFDYHSDLERANRLGLEIGRQSGLKVALPQPGETYHQAKLLGSNGIVLFRETAPESWFEAHREKIQQTAALRRGPAVPEAYYLVRPGIPQQVISTHNRPTRWEIDRVGEPEVADLGPFLEALQCAAAAAGGRL